MFFFMNFVISALICIEPAPVPNAELVVSGFDPSNTATYKCNECYEKTSGDLVLSCMRGGIWSGVVPKCTGRFRKQHLEFMQLQ